METKDLRIGNLVWWNRTYSYDTPFEPCVISIDDFNDLRDEPVDMSRYIPMPLTEKLLSKNICKEDDGYHFRCGRKELILIWDDRTWQVLYVSNVGIRVVDLNIDLEYIHELQNLYYALMKEELVLAAAP